MKDKKDSKDGVSPVSAYRARLREAFLSGTLEYHHAESYAAGCRCAVCVASHNAAKANAKARRDAAAAARPPRSPAAEIHGISRYRRKGCRCDVCRAAGKAARAKDRASAARRLAEGTYTAHGVSGYAAGCRCGVCRAARAVR